MTDAQLDFRALPFEEAVSILQVVGRELIVALLENRSPQVLDLLTHEAVDSLLSRQRQRRITYNRIIYKARRNVIPQDEWYSDVMAALGNELRMGSGMRLPDPMWSLAAAQAWTDLAFCNDIASEVESYLHCHAIWDVEDPPPTVIFAPETYWLLLVLSAPFSRDVLIANPLETKSETDLSWWENLRQNWRQILRRLSAQFRHRLRQQRVVGFFRQQGIERGIRPGWATLWDQWALLIALRVWQPQRYRLTGIGPVRRALLDLPLVPYFADESGIDLPEPSKTLAAQEWDVNIPRWFKIWLDQQPLTQEGN